MKKSLFALLALSIVLGSCSRSIKLKEYQTSITHNGKYQIVTPAFTNYKFKSQNPFHAFVSEDGLIVGNYVGETNIVVYNDYDEVFFHVTVAPTYLLYIEPEIHFGDSKNSILAQFGNPVQSNESSCLFSNFDGSGCALLVSFNQANRVIAYTVLVPYSYYKELAYFLEERYKTNGSSNDTSYFINALEESEATMSVTVWPYNGNFWCVLYKPTSEKFSLSNSDLEQAASAVI